MCVKFSVCFELGFCSKTRGTSWWLHEFDGLALHYSWQTRGLFTFLVFLSKLLCFWYKVGILIVCNFLLCFTLLLIDVIWVIVCYACLDVRLNCYFFRRDGEYGILAGWAFQMALMYEWVNGLKWIAFTPYWLCYANVKVRLSVKFWFRVSVNHV